MPYGTVNLKHGVPQGETPITCTAGVGTFSIEFGVLSQLSGLPIYEEKARKAVRSIWKKKSVSFRVYCRSFAAICTSDKKHPIFSV